MKATIQTIFPTDLDLNILGITILSEEEVEYFKGKIKEINKPWFYRPNIVGSINNSNKAILSYEHKEDLYYNNYNPSFWFGNPRLGVRPVIFFTKCKLNNFIFGDFPWTKLSPNMAICDDIIGKIDAFTGPNDYGIEGSRFDFIKRAQNYMEEWLREQIKNTKEGDENSNS